MPDTAQQTFIHHPECLTEAMKGELLVYLPTNATTLHLNDSSALVWQLCDGERTVNDIIAELKAAYPNEQAAIANDVLDVIKQLLEANILLPRQATD